MLLQFLHFNDNDKMPGPQEEGYSRLYKIKPVLDELFAKFQEVYTPREAICVDESLLLYKGRLIFKQYGPMKRARFGIKIYLCCESDGDKKGSGGYCFRFKIYAGKDDPIDDILPVLRESSAYNPALSISENVVLFMTLPLLNQGYHVYTDNWYTSLRLYMYLLEKRTLACGTIRLNRGIPLELDDVRLAKGASAAVCGDSAWGQVVATKYHSTKVIHLLSTIHGHSDAPIEDRRESGVNRQPLVSAQYNRNMGGVDRQDQLIEPYDCTRKSMKWTKKLFFHLMQMSACNAFILQKERGVKSFKEFLEAVILSWLYDQADMPRTIEVDLHDDMVRLSERGHYPFQLPAAQKARPCKPCRVCKKKFGIRRDQRFFCPSCPSQPGLCVGQCFADYHQKVEYWK